MILWCQTKKIEIEIVTFFLSLCLRFQIIQFYDFLLFYNTFVFKRLSALKLFWPSGKFTNSIKTSPKSSKRNCNGKRNRLLHIVNEIRKSLIKPCCHILFMIVEFSCVFQRSHFGLFSKCNKKRSAILLKTFVNSPYKQTFTLTLTFQMFSNTKREFDNYDDRYSVIKEKKTMQPKCLIIFYSQVCKTGKKDRVAELFWLKQTNKTNNKSIFSETWFYTLDLTFWSRSY